ncbi:MAG: serine/threonine protein kinase [Phycisphaerae bacterium]|nr:serine/threonine protein kinase [Phycisphaerae bacterium]
MSAERAARVEAIFLSAVDLPPERRGAHLDGACAGDASLRREVESLLAHHASDDGLLESRDAPGLNLLSQFGAMALPTEEPTLPADRRIGTYTVQGLLGSGGMGVVYLAQQERPRRTVALKVLRAGAGSARLLRRFEYEAEVLGRLQHPGIAQVYEAGVYRGGGGVYPFIAMELVRGRTLTAYAQERALDLRGRLDLFARVCDAVQHAHQHGVIHRDLKPANILVADPPAGHTGEHAQPKVLDFGVARAMDDGRNDTTAHTHVGQIIGTLPYMSPEQIGGAPDAVDTRSDVYALGVVLYELLAGRLPYDVKSRSLPDAARVIRDEEPTRLSTIARVFRGDVETIVATALAKERHRRYQSAADLGADVRRFLAGEPLSARPDSAM